MEAGKHLKDFLEGLEDFELAFLCRYNFESHLEENKTYIKEFISKRRFSNEEINRLIKEYSGKKFADNKIRCLRCNSDKIQMINHTNFICCNVCGLSEDQFRREKELRRPKWKKILDAIVGFLTSIG